MQTPARPANEEQRLASLQRMQLLDTPDEEAFDRITRIAQHLFAVPIALVSLVDLNRQWFKSCVGLPVRETPRDVSFCGHAILGNDLFIIENAPADERFADNPLVTGGPNIRFYAGRPLRNAEGYNIGTLCIIDDKPRHLSGEQRRMFNDLGIWAETVLRLRQLSESQQMLLQQLDAAQRNAQIDPLLQVWNQQGIRALVEQELQLRTQTPRPLLIASVSLDQYPSLQQRYGVDFANQALKQMCSNVRSLSGEHAQIGRVRDDELLLLRTDAASAEAESFGNQLRKAINAADTLTTVEGQTIPFSASIGMVAIRPELTSLALSDLLSAIEQAHYQAKRNGGNQVYCNLI